MKTNDTKYLKMKLFLTLIITVVLAVPTISAQEVKMAILQQKNNSQVFYGDDALKKALEAADHGDLITLSAGTFKVATIDKAIILQGAGYVTDAINGRFPTVIEGKKLEIRLPDVQQNLTIEGIYVKECLEVQNNLISGLIRKCHINELVIKGKSKNCIIDQCRFRILNMDDECENLLVRSSIIKYMSGAQSTSALLKMENCIIFSVSYSANAYFINNIIRSVPYYTSEDAFLSSSSIAKNNVFIKGKADNCVIQLENKRTDSMTLFGKDLLNINQDSDTELYELTETAKVTYLGTDGTQVGLYGGTSPFTDVPTNPQVIKKEIDNQSSPDGKLKVSITVEAQ